MNRIVEKVNFPIPKQPKAKRVSALNSHRFLGLLRNIFQSNSVVLCDRLLVRYSDF